MLKANFKKHTLQFKQASGTSRGVLHTKDSWFILLWNENKPDIVGIGECSIIKGLSIDDRPDFEVKLQDVCLNIETVLQDSKSLMDFPSIQFGLEMAISDLKSFGNKILFPSQFTEGKTSIHINGLIWMGDPDFMRMQLKEKINAGYSCIKMKIGAIDFESELEILRLIRKDYSEKELELRVDANGAFTSSEAMQKLDSLREYKIHSIEQPIRQGQIEQMARICKNSPIPIALDEELIRVHTYQEKFDLLKQVKPQYIILKPSLLGGFVRSKEWIDIANNLNIDWWVTSALESNIGLSAIAQWTYTLANKLPQGLGTGQLYTNNIDSPLLISKGELHYMNENNWDLNLLHD